MLTQRHPEAQRVFTFRPSRKERVKKERKGLAAREKLSLQWNPTARRYLMNYPLFNTDLHQLVAALGIKNFRGVFSRDALPSRSHKVECGIVNLDDIQGPARIGLHITLQKKVMITSTRLDFPCQRKLLFTLAKRCNTAQMNFKIGIVYQKPSGKTDAVAMQHNVYYSLCGDDKKYKNKADAKMVKALDSIPWNERQWGHCSSRFLSLSMFL